MKQYKVIISGGSITSVVATNFGKNYKKNDTLTLAGASVGGNAITLNVDTVQTGAKTAYSTIETAIEKVTNAQSHLGAMQNRFAHNISHFSLGFPLMLLKVLRCSLVFWGGSLEAVVLVRSS